MNNDSYSLLNLWGIITYIVSSEEKGKFNLAAYNNNAKYPDIRITIAKGLKGNY